MLRARLYLAARGIARSREALAGALLEAELHDVMMRFLTEKPKKGR